MSAEPATPILPLQPLCRRAPLALRWRSMAQVGLRMMFHDKLKMLGTLVGAVFAVVLSNQQAGTFMGLIYKNVMFIEQTEADLWIAPPATEQFQAGRAISTAALLRARGTPGVRWAEPLLVGGAAVALPDGGFAVRSRTIAVDEGFDKFTPKTTWLPSIAAPLPMVMVGAGSLSIIVPMPLFTVVTLPLIAAPPSVNVSSGSSVVS